MRRIKLGTVTTPIGINTRNGIGAFTKQCVSAWTSATEHGKWCKEYAQDIYAIHDTTHLDETEIAVDIYADFTYENYITHKITWQNTKQ